MRALHDPGHAVFSGVGTIELSVYIRSANRSLARALQAQQALDFFCECDRPSCRERVRITREKYDELSTNGVFLVAPAHSADGSAAPNGRAD